MSARWPSPKGSQRPQCRQPTAPGRQGSSSCRATAATGPPEVPLEPGGDRVGVGVDRRTGREAAGDPAVDLADLAQQARLDHLHAAAEGVGRAALRAELRGQLALAAHLADLPGLGEPGGEAGQALRERAADVEQRQPEKKAASGLQAQQQPHAPGLVDLVALGVAHELGRAGGAAGVEVAGRLIRPDLPPARQALAGLGIRARCRTRSRPPPPCRARRRPP